MKRHEKVTVVIKTFLRPGKIHRLVQSIKKFFPDVPIIVVDDGDPLAEQHKSFPGGVTVIELPFDSGLSAGRNAGVAAVETPYVFLLDDDFLVDDNAPINEAVEYLEQHPEIDILGIRLKGPSGVQNFAQRMERRGRACVRFPSQEREGDHLWADYILNCFVARTEVLQKYKWADYLKIAEHWEYFWRVRGKVNVALYMKGFVHHARGKSNRRYLRFRNRTHRFKRLGLRKHGFRVLKQVQKP